MRGDGGLGGAVAVPGDDLLTEAVGEVVAGRTVADGAEFPAGFVVVAGQAAGGEVGQRVAVGHSRAAGRDRGGAQAAVDGGGVRGEAAGAGLGGGEAEPYAVEGLVGADGHGGPPGGPSLVED